MIGLGDLTVPVRRGIRDVDLPLAGEVEERWPGPVDPVGGARARRSNESQV